MPGPNRKTRQSMSTNFPAHNPIQARTIKTRTKEDHPEEIPTILMILDRQEEDRPEEDRPEEDHLDHPKEEGYQIGNSDIQEEDHPDPPGTPRRRTARRRATRRTTAQKRRKQ